MEIKGKIRYIIEFLLIILGAIIAAFAIEEFLVPCTILDGGVVGIGIIISSLSTMRLSILTIAINLPFLIIGSKKLGKIFVCKSFVAMIVFSIFIEIFKEATNATEQPLLAVCFGGVIMGIGVGLVIRYGACLDGSEVIAILANKKYKVSVGNVVLIINIIIYSIAGIIFGLDRAMYSLLTYFVTSRTLDYIEYGIEKKKAAMIITNEAEEISNLIYERLGRTVTIIEGEGLVSGRKVILYCILTRFEVRELRNIINEVEHSAFIAVSDVTDVIGNHIKKTEKKIIEKRTNR